MGLCKILFRKRYKKSKVVVLTPVKFSFLIFVGDLIKATDREIYLLIF